MHVEKMAAKLNTSSAGVGVLPFHVTLFSLFNAQFIYLDDKVSVVCVRMLQLIWGQTPTLFPTVLSYALLNHTLCTMLRIFRILPDIIHWKNFLKYNVSVYGGLLDYFSMVLHYLQRASYLI